ncbi:hypothetical protein B296_00043589 [Ensete ventricosum]|uniref:Uncharacterized protein n=1 Tax=Ensete ventricosum TaxID=4639 RepID=A0A426Z5H9_ENSVE|nr:hypothetical protein B296_00043589 [Ensete ventricosum]
MRAMAFRATEATIEENEGNGGKRVEQQDRAVRKGSRSGNRGNRYCKRAVAEAGDVGEGREVIAVEDVGGGMDFGGWEEKEEGNIEGLATVGCVLPRADRRQW